MAISDRHTKSYTELSEELAQLLQELEQGDMDIEQAVKCYERGLAIVSQLEVHLTKAENKVKELGQAAGTDKAEL